MIIITSFLELASFLEEKGVALDIRDDWKCPKCGAENHGAYFGHEVKCSECGKFSHPGLEMARGKVTIKSKSKRLIGLENMRDGAAAEMEGLRDVIFSLGGPGCMEKELFNRLKDDIDDWQALVDKCDPKIMIEQGCLMSLLEQWGESETKRKGGDEE